MSLHPPLSGFVHLILLSSVDGDEFYLEIPINIAYAVCLNPRKYLRYLGWCVLGVEGVLADEQGKHIPLNGDLLDLGIYRYIVSGGNSLAHAIDLEVIKQRTQVPSETTATREDFREKLLARDGCCVWTGLDGVGMHIIPFRRGDEACSRRFCLRRLVNLDGSNQWLQLIIDNRPHHHDENLESISINDIRNGIYADDNLHNHYFDPREVVILKTPNPILQITDVPVRALRDIDSRCSFPETSRYTLQWIVDPKRQAIQRHFPNNNDATFSDQNLPKPADLLLHYNYGAAVVKHWGKNISILTDRPDIPRPSIPAQAAMGPTRIKHDRNVTIQKRVTATEKGQVAGKDSATTGWDEDDVILFFWGNTKVVRERVAYREQERNTFMQDWRATVTS